MTLALSCWHKSSHHSRIPYQLRHLCLKTQGQPGGKTLPGRKPPIEKPWVRSSVGKKARGQWSKSSEQGAPAACGCYKCDSWALNWSCKAGFTVFSHKGGKKTPCFLAVPEIPKQRKPNVCGILDIFQTIQPQMCLSWPQLATGFSDILTQREESFRSSLHIRESRSNVWISGQRAQCS